MSAFDKQPLYPNARVRVRRGYPYCDQCGRRVQDARQHRCPWVGCQKWFRGRATPEPVSAKQRARKERARN